MSRGEYSYSKATTRLKSRHPHVRYIFAHPMGNSDLRLRHYIYIYIYYITNKQTTKQEACGEMLTDMHLITKDQKKVTALLLVGENKIETACAIILSS